MNATRSLLAAAALASAMLGSASALAQAVQSAAPRAAQATQTAAPALYILHIHDLVEASCFANMRVIDLDKYCHFKSNSRNPHGGRVQLHVHAQTGEIERNRFYD